MQIISTQWISNFSPLKIRFETFCSTHTGIHTLWERSRKSKEICINLSLLLIWSQVLTRIDRSNRKIESWTFTLIHGFKWVSIVVKRWAKHNWTIYLRTCIFFPPIIVDDYTIRLFGKTNGLNEAPTQHFVNRPVVLWFCFSKHRFLEYNAWCQQQEILCVITLHQHPSLKNTPDCNFFLRKKNRLWLCNHWILITQVLTWNAHNHQGQGCAGELKVRNWTSTSVVIVIWLDRSCWYFSLCNATADDFWGENWHRRNTELLVTNTAHQHIVVWSLSGVNGGWFKT